MLTQPKGGFRGEQFQNNLCLFLLQRKVLGSQVSLDKKGKDTALEPEGPEDPKHGSKENVNMVRISGRISFLFFFFCNMLKGSLLRIAVLELCLHIASFYTVMTS